MTFKKLFKAGQCTITSIDAWTDLWHKGIDKKESLKDFLGLTDEEYQIWVMDGEAALAQKLNAGQPPEHTAIHLDWDTLQEKLQVLITRKLGFNCAVSIKRIDYYDWQIELEANWNMDEEFSKKTCEDLQLENVEDDIFLMGSGIDAGSLFPLLSELVHREVTSTHADDYGVWIICRSLIWTSPKYTKQMIAACEKRLRHEIKYRRYPTVNQDTACHQLFGFLEALKMLGLLDPCEWYVDPDHFKNIKSEETHMGEALK